jgi:hypothetical protein
VTDCPSGFYSVLGQADCTSCSPGTNWEIHISHIISIINHKYIITCIVTRFILY